MKLKHLIVLLCTAFLTLHLHSQNRKLDRAQRSFEGMAFIDAIEIYKKVYEAGYHSPEIFYRLGDAYFFNAEYAKATAWYEKFFKDTTDSIAPIYELRFAQCLNAIDQKELSKHYYNNFLKKTGFDSISSGVRTAEYYMDLIQKNSGRYTVKPMALNSEGVDFGTSFYGDKVVFASTRDTISAHKRISAWDGLSFLDLYQVKQSELVNTDSPKVKSLPGDVNSKYHESTACFTSDGKTMFFTRNNSTPSDSKENKLKIYRAELIEGKWTNVSDLSINGDDFSNAHPALSVDGSRLYFVSDRPGSIGETDLYYADILDKKGRLGNAVNLGKDINTPGRESFPFVTADGKLYFSSDGHFGLGGYDVFYARPKKDGGYRLLNVGKPINSSQDDICFVIRDNRGFLSSNRPESGRYDDIYSFVEHINIEELFKGKINGTVLNIETKTPLKRATVSLFDDSGNEISKLVTDELGIYEFTVDQDLSYYLKSTKMDFQGDDAYVQMHGRELHEQDLLLKPVAQEVTNGFDLAKLLNIVIYFDFDKYHIRDDAKVELEKLVVALKEYPKLQVSIRSHTDSRATDQYNLRLSGNRAKATREYLVSRGISPTRLQAKGMGETELINHCSDGVICSESEHQKNRRSEFIIVKSLDSN